ncbi:MAG: LysR family transcriptional regulator [Rhodospirillales bacterium]|nr:LysR family transcriptional regulator [Rhodospirillales bacterium]
MPRDPIADLSAFLSVARERSFTRAAARLSVSPSALSHTIRRLEERLGVRLLTRTTRSVSATEAGERLLRTVGPYLDQVGAELEGLSDLRDKPAGTVRITAGDHPAETILTPALAKLLPRYPDLRAEVVVSNGLVDIAAEGFDAGVRLGETLALDTPPVGRGRKGQKRTTKACVLAVVERPRDAEIGTVAGGARASVVVDLSAVETERGPRRRRSTWPRPI